MLDRRLGHIQAELRDDLGRWAVRRREALGLKASTAEAGITASAHTRAYLREQWAQQRAAQLSIRRRTLSSVPFAPR